MTPMFFVFVFGFLCLGLNGLPPQPASPLTTRFPSKSGLE
jgi:hypothetical protein